MSVTSSGRLTDAYIAELLAKRPPMTAHERHAQRASWAFGNVAIGHPEWTPEQSARFRRLCVEQNGPCPCVDCFVARQKASNAK